MALQSFQEVVTGRCVTPMCDNSTVVAYVNKQGRTVSHSLCLLASRLLRWTESLDFHLYARYLPGDSNVLADLLSRGDKVFETEWSHHPQVASSLLRVGLVRDVPQHEASHILFSRPGSPGGLRGYVSPSLGQHGHLRVSTLSSGLKGSGQSQRDPQSLHDPGGSSLARKGVVRGPSPFADPTTSRAALMGPAVETAPLQLLPPRRPRAEPSGMATLRRILQKLGFS